jgi:hypothetical protein
VKIPTVAEAFATYRAEVLPADAPDVQVQECRRAFYAGTYGLLMGGLLVLGDESVPEEDGIAALEALKAECEAFAASGGLVEPPVDPNARAFESLAAMQRAAEKAGILPADIHHEAPAALVADLRPLLERLGRNIGGDLPDGWGFALFLFTLGEAGHTFYIANCDRADVLTALHEFIRRQTQ